MSKKCILCKKNHGEIYQRFDRFFETDTIDIKKMQEFVKFIEFELNEENWNEVNCLIDNMHDSMKLKNNLKYNEIQFLNILFKIKILCIKNPTLGSFIELKESLSNNFMKLNSDMGSGIKKNTVIDYQNEFNILLDCLNKIKKLEIKDKASEELKEYIILITPLKNYIIFRMISFFEQRIYDILVDTINDLPANILYDIKGSTMTLSTQSVIDSQDSSIGHLAVLDLKNNPKDIDEIIYQILKNKTKTQKFINLKLHSSFFDYFGNIIRINNPELSKYFSEKSEGKWWRFIRNLNESRNQMTHELTNPKYTTSELENEIRLMYILLISFPKVLQFVLDYFPKIKNADEFIELYKILKKFLDNEECEILPYDECLKEIISTFIYQKSNN